MPHRTDTTKLAAAALLALALTACNRQTAYHHYEHTPADGWERTDTLTFHIPPVASGGTYQADVGVRTNARYPFRNLSLVVTRTQPGHRPHTDTLRCLLDSRQGPLAATGISASQWQYPLGLLQLARGDSLHLTIRHQMRRELLQGITDVGVRLTRRPSSTTQHPSPNTQHP